MKLLSGNFLTVCRSLSVLEYMFVHTLHPVKELCFLYLQQVKLSSPDYVDCDKEEAVADFLKRIDCYKLAYVPLDDDKDR